MSNILCIDIGGTRIKAAILRNDIDLYSLKNTKVEVIRSLGWLNSSLPEIISKVHPSSIIQRNNNLADFDSISISVPVKVINDGTEISGSNIEKRGIPRDLKKAFETQSNCEVILLNDAVSWLSGALNYCRLCSIEIEFPCLFIALGTGVGIGYSEQMNDIENIELSNRNFRYIHLTQATRQLVDKGWKVHGCLGEKYIISIKYDHKDWTYQNIQSDFTNRVAALLLDFKGRRILDFDKLKTIFIGGGNAEYINSDILRNVLQKNIFMLTSSSLQITPDLIPLLGLIKLS